jgi:hypothetical protein
MGVTVNDWKNNRLICVEKIVTYAEQAFAGDIDCFLIISLQAMILMACGG